MTRPSFFIEVHTSAPALEAEWRALETEGHATPFQCYDFVAPLYAAFEAFQEARPLIVTVRAAAGGPLLMILPLCQREEAGLRLIEFADVRVADYCAPVLAQGDWSGKARFRTLWRAIEKKLPSADAIRLRKLSLTVGAVSNPLLMLQPIDKYHVGAHGIPIAAPWREKAADVIGKSERYRLRRAERGLDKLGDITLTIAMGDETATALFPTLLEQRTLRFAELGRDDIMVRPMWQAFFRDLTEGTTTGRPIAQLMALALDSHPIATALGFVRDGTYFLIILAIEMAAHNRHAPGKVMLYMAMEVFADQGLDYFDFTTGDEPYKKDFGGDDKSLFMVVRPRSVRGAQHCLSWKAKQIMRRYPKTRAFLKKTLSRN